MHVNPHDVAFTAIVLAGAGGAATLANGLVGLPRVRLGAQVLIGVTTLLILATRLGLL